MCSAGIFRLRTIVSYDFTKLIKFPIAFFVDSIRFDESFPRPIKKYVSIKHLDFFLKGVGRRKKRFYYKEHVTNYFSILIALIPHFSCILYEFGNALLGKLSSGLHEQRVCVYVYSVFQTRLSEKVSDFLPTRFARKWSHNGPRCSVVSRNSLVASARNRSYLRQYTRCSLTISRTLPKRIRSVSAIPSSPFYTSDRLNNIFDAFKCVVVDADEVVSLHGNIPRSDGRF